MSENAHGTDPGLPGAANPSRGWQENIGHKLSLTFEDSVLEDDFQAMYWRSRRTLMWLGCYTGFVWTCIMGTSGYLQLNLPHIFEMCCKQVFEMQFGRRELITVLMQLPFPLTGVVGFWSSRISFKYVRMMYFVCRWDTGVLQTDTSAAEAAVLRSTMGMTVICIWPCALMPLVATAFQILGSQVQLQWVLACFGTILHLLFLPHLLWVAVVFAVAFISTVYTIASRSGGACVGTVLFQVVRV